MPIRAIAAVIFGLIHLLFWMVFGTSAVVDPGGWGPCPPLAMFPIEAPYPQDEGTFCFDCYVCEIRPQLIPVTALVMVLVFGVSGALTLRLAKTSRLLVGLIPTGILLAFWFAKLWQTERILPLETAIAGATIVTLSLVSALLGAAIAKRTAPKKRESRTWS